MKRAAWLVVLIGTTVTPAVGAGATASGSALTGTAPAGNAPAGNAPAGNAPAGNAATDEFKLAITIDAAEESGRATATIRIHANREVLWHVLTNCEEALKIVPGLKYCAVEETAADQSWQRIRQIVDYSWYVPRVSYDVRATYDKPSGISFEKVSGDVARLRGSWLLESDADYTIAHYEMEFAPGFWVPRWVVRAALKRDLPKMLHALRARAEAAHGNN